AGLLVRVFQSRGRGRSAGGGQCGCDPCNLVQKGAPAVAHGQGFIAVLVHCRARSSPSVSMVSQWPLSRTARPAADRFSNRISEYLRERITPSAPAFRAAATAA